MYIYVLLSQCAIYAQSAFHYMTERLCVCVFRGKKTRKNREFRDAVLGTSSTATASSSSQSPTVSAILSAVTWTDAQEAIVSLQLEAGCVVRLCSGKEQLAEYIFTLTKAISEKPFRSAYTCIYM